jgi:hypothetical protein
MITMMIALIMINHNDDCVVDHDYNDIFFEDNYYYADCIDYDDYIDDCFDDDD